jgi:hypothetical protein
VLADGLIAEFGGEGVDLLNVEVKTNGFLPGTSQPPTASVKWRYPPLPFDSRR